MCGPCREVIILRKQIFFCGGRDSSGQTPHQQPRRLIPRQSSSQANQAEGNKEVFLEEYVDNMQVVAVLLIPTLARAAHEHRALTGVETTDQQQAQTVHTPVGGSKADAAADQSSETASFEHTLEDEHSVVSEDAKQQEQTTR